MCRKRMSEAAARLAVIAVVLAAVGCQRGRPLPPSVGLSGAVTRDGRVVTDGLLTMYPLDNPGAAPVGVVITAGRYDAPVVPKGRYRVVLSSTCAPNAYQSTGDVVAPVANRPEPPIETLPSVVVEVDEKSTSFDFTLQSG